LEFNGRLSNKNVQVGVDARNNPLAKMVVGWLKSKKKFVSLEHVRYLQACSLT